MADFYPVLSRAIDGLADQTPEARRAIYDRAKQVLVAQLRSVDPPVSESEITRQRLALDEVIARIEREKAAPPAPAPEPLPLPEPDFRDEPQPYASEPVEPEPEALRQEMAGHETRTRGTRPVMASVEADEPAAPSAAERPRVEFAPAPRPRFSPRKLIVVSGVLLGVAAIGATAYYVNQDNRSTPVAVQVPARPAQPAAEGPKINERAGGEPAQPLQPAQQPVLSGPGGPPAQAPLAVAQRAVLYIEPAETSQPPRAITGRVSWRVEAQNPGQGQPLETVIRADAEIPDSGLTLIFTIRRNSDPAFPASHIIGMRFQRTVNDANGGVREAGVPQFKTEENERGAPLSAITSALGENLFVSALSRVPVEVERNVDLIRTRNWIDIPLRFASGKRGIIAFEKGLSGDQRIAEGFRSWQ